MKQRASDAALQCLPKGEGGFAGSRGRRHKEAGEAAGPATPPSHSRGGRTKAIVCVLTCWVLACIGPGYSGVQVITNATQHVFSGPDRKITLTIQNSGDSAANVDLHAKVSQASSATTAPLDNFRLKNIRVLAGQTIIESPQFSFPNVRGETPFVIQWIDGTNNVIGTSSVLVYPPDVLKELKTLAGDDAIGLFDPNTRIKPLLKNLNVEFVDLDNSGAGHFDGKLAILGPFESKNQMSEITQSAIHSMAKNGVGIVWIQPRPDARAPLKPSYYTVVEGKGTIVVVHPELVADLQHNPEAQKNLIALAHLALYPTCQNFQNSRLPTTDY